MEEVEAYEQSIVDEMNEDLKDNKWILHWRNCGVKEDLIYERYLNQDGSPLYNYFHAYNILCRFIFFRHINSEFYDRKNKINTDLLYGISLKEYCLLFLNQNAVDECITLAASVPLPFEKPDCYLGCLYYFFQHKLLHDGFDVSEDMIDISKYQSHVHENKHQFVILNRLDKNDFRKWMSYNNRLQMFEYNQNYYKMKQLRYLTSNKLNEEILYKINFIQPYSEHITLSYLNTHKQKMVDDLFSLVSPLIPSVVK